MTIEQAIVLAIIQGLTEFLPVSSSGHLVLISWLFDWPDQGIAFDAAIHLGTLGAVLIYFRAIWMALIRGVIKGGMVRVSYVHSDSLEFSARRMTVFLLIGTVPVAICGFFVGGNKTLIDFFRQPEIVGGVFIVTGAVLTIGEIIGRKTRGLPEITHLDSFKIGLAQVLALIPGISRSGMTIATGMIANLSREASATFSFLLCVPVIAGSGLFLLIDAAWSLNYSAQQWWVVLMGVCISFITGYLAIGGLMKLLTRSSLKPFIAYIFFVGIAVIIARMFGL